MKCETFESPDKIIVSTGDWLGKPANIKVENNGDVVYVGSSLTVHNTLSFVHKVTEKINAMFRLVSKFKMIGMPLYVGTVRPKKRTKKYNKRV